MNDTSHGQNVHTNTTERAEITFGDVHFGESIPKVAPYSSIESAMALSGNRRCCGC